MRYRTVFLIALACLHQPAIYGCDDLSFKDPWIRETPPAAKTAAAYVSIHNGSDRLIKITQAKADCCDMVMFHQTVVTHGITRMQHLEEIVVDAGEHVSLRPLDSHLMLIRPQTRLRAGDKIPINFHCDTDPPHTVVFTVEKP